MDSTDLTEVQTDALRRQIAHHLRYLRKLKDRMDAPGFPEYDLLYIGRPVKRRLFAILSALSLLLFVAVVALPSVGR